MSLNDFTLWIRLESRLVTVSSETRSMSKSSLKSSLIVNMAPGPTFIKPDQLDPWIKDQMKITLLSTISPLQLPNFVSWGGGGGGGGQALPHDTKFGNCRDKIVDSRTFLRWSLIHGSSWSGLIKLAPGPWCEMRCRLDTVARVPRYM